MSWPLFDRIRAYAKSGGVFQQERIFQDQSSLDRMLSSGEFIDFNQQQALLDQTNLQINRLERYKDYEQMDEVGEVSLALDLYADETSLVDPERKHTLIIKAANKAVKEELDELFFKRLLIDNQIRALVRYLCKYGDFPAEIIPNQDRKGVASLKFMNVYNFTRVETKFGDLIGFYYQDELMSEPVFLHPWQVMHLRLTSFENIYHPYGRAILEGGRKAFKQLRLMEDAALIYRITRAPEKRVFKIPVGQIPAKEVPEYMQQIARQFKNTRFYDPRTGQFNERFSPLIQEDDFFLPSRPDGSGPTVETLKGAENLNDIKDIEYFKKKMIAPMKIPFARVGIGEGAGEGQEKSLASTDSQFSKAVQWVQREVAIGLTKVAICHLAMAGYSIEQIKGFSISMSATSAIDELYRIETWASRASVMADLKDLKWFPKSWIVGRFTDLSPEDIIELDELEENEPQEAEAGGGGGGGGGSPIGGLPEGPGGIGGPADPNAPLDAESPEGEPNPVGAGFGGGGNPDEEAGDIGNEMGQMTGGMESYNYAVEKEVIIESRRIKRRDKILEFVERIRKSDVSSVDGHYSYLLEQNELNGLSSGKDGNTRVLVESTLDVAMVKEHRNQYHKILCGSDDPECDEDAERADVTING